MPDRLPGAALLRGAVAMPGTAETGATDRYPARAVRLVVPFPPGAAFAAAVRLAKRFRAGGPVLRDSKRAGGESRCARTQPARGAGPARGPGRGTDRRQRGAKESGPAKMPRRPRQPGHPHTACAIPERGTAAPFHAEVQDGSREERYCWVRQSLIQVLKLCSFGVKSVVPTTSRRCPLPSARPR